MSKEGFVQCFRKFADWEWYTDSFTFHLFFHCIISANHKDNYYRGILIKRGQFRTGRKKLSIETGLSEQQIRTCLRRLKSTNEITIFTNTQYSIITVNNYDKYQGIFTKSTSDLTNEQPTSNQRLTTNNNDNNDNNDNKCVSEKKFIPPTQTDVEDFLKIIGKKVPTKTILDFINYWSASDWCDKNGLKINNWKQKALSWVNRDEKFIVQQKTKQEEEQEKEKRKRERLKAWAERKD